MMIKVFILSNNKLSYHECDINNDISISSLTLYQTIVLLSSQIRKRSPCDIICIWYSIVCIFLIRLIESIQFIDAEQTQKWKNIFIHDCMCIWWCKKKAFWWQIWYSTVLSCMDISTIRLYNNWSQGEMVLYSLGK